MVPLLGGHSFIFFWGGQGGVLPIELYPWGTLELLLPGFCSCLATSREGARSGSASTKAAVTNIPVCTMRHVYDKSTAWLLRFVRHTYLWNKGCTALFVLTQRMNIKVRNCNQLVVASCLSSVSPWSVQSTPNLPNQNQGEKLSNLYWEKRKTGITSWTRNTVDGRNPAPPGMCNTSKTPPNNRINYISTG